MCRQQIVVILTTIIIGLSFAEDNTTDIKDDNWQGLWFPSNPDGRSKEEKSVSVDDKTEIQLKSDEDTIDNKKDDKKVNWIGPWFPQLPENASKESSKANSKQNLPTTNDRINTNFVDNEEALQMSESRFIDKNESWNGPWFPGPPGQTLPITPIKTVSKEHVNDNQLNNMIKSDYICDDGIANLVIDYDPGNITHHSRHLCIDERSLYAPSYEVNPRLLDYTIPPEYKALHKCMDDVIEYDDPIPTFGSHRKIWPVYGEYVYVPPQRWIHSLEHGAIVLLYHPCVNLNQLDILKNLITKCLYRHIITAYDLLEPERPFALVAWGRSLEFSVVDQLTVISFIRLYALQGPEKIFSDGQYNQTLIEQSNIITSVDDNVLCQNL